MRPAPLLRFGLSLLVLSAAVGTNLRLFAQEAATPDAASGEPVRGSIVEDRAAAKLIEAGDSRYEAEEMTKAVEIWESVVERYPRSRVRYEAHMRLGNFFLGRDRAYDRARVHFEAVAVEDNRDEQQRAEANLKMGVCFYEARNYGKSFQVMRDVIEKFPVSPQVNEAYYYIGLGHFQLGHYSRAIQALEKVGTTLAADDSRIEKVEAGKRLFVKIEDADLAALEPGEPIKVRCEATSGDVEIVDCFSVGRNVRIVLGSIVTQLGRPKPENGTLELKGDDKVKVTYVDQHTADKQFDRPLNKEIVVVGNAVVAVTDGAFSETLRGVVLGKTINVQIIDPDLDLSDAADTLTARVEVYRAKTDEEIAEEQIEALKKQGNDTAAPPADGEDALKIDRLKKVDSVEIVLTEAKISRAVSTLKQEGLPVPADGPDGEQAAAEGAAAATPAATAEPDPGNSPAPANAGQPQTSPAASTDPDDDSVHSGTFRASLSLVKSDEVDTADDVLQALPGDIVRVVYLDERNTGEGIREVQFDARCIEGNLGGVRVTRAQISDQELRVRTKLKTADALTNIGNRYKEFGLKTNADAKYQQALGVCEEIMREATQLGGKLLEESYVQLWKIYFEMDRLELAAAMAQRLQRDFPNSGFVDDALLQLAEVARKQGNLNRAIGIYTRLATMEGSQLRGEAQFGIAQCYETMADQTAAAGNEAGAAQLYDRSFQEFKRVFDSFPESGRVGEAVSRMANYYYRQKDYARAVDTFETVLANYPDAKFLDVILFNYGRCLYRMNRRPEARQRFDQLIQDYPESQLASDAKKISDALAKSGF